MNYTKEGHTRIKSTIQKRKKKYEYLRRRNQLHSRSRSGPVRSCASAVRWRGGIGSGPSCSRTGCGAVRQSFSLLTDARQPRKPHHGPQLQHVFFPSHALVLLSKLFSQPFTSVDILRADKVDRDLHAICQVANLSK